jgi:hypothetical protein
MATWPTAPIVRTNGFEAAAQPSAPLSSAVPPYLSTEQLAQVTPWSVSAVHTMVKRGVFQRGVHYFQPGGKGGALVFKWSAVVELIEGACTKATVVATTTATDRTKQGRKVFDAAKATAVLRRVLDQPA